VDVSHSQLSDWTRLQWALHSGGLVIIDVAYMIMVEIRLMLQDHLTVAVARQKINTEIHRSNTLRRNG